MRHVVHLLKGTITASLKGPGDAISTLHWIPVHCSISETSHKHTWKHKEKKCLNTKCKLLISNNLTNKFTV